MICALRFRGYEYLEVAGLDGSGSTLADPVVETFQLHVEPAMNFAAFFLLQRYLFKWCGERWNFHASERGRSPPSLSLAIPAGASGGFCKYGDLREEGVP